MNMKKSLLGLMLSTSILAFSQEESNQLIHADALKNVDINLLLRSAYESPVGSAKNGFKMNEARLEIRGKVVKDLEFRVRTRLHKADPVRDFGNSTSNLDMAYAAYKFGQNKNWQVTVGKQPNLMGSWEFEKNPTFEYKYSKAVGGYNNLFAMGANISYSPSTDHTFIIQGINTNNDSFNKVVGTNTNWVAAKTPLLAQAAWQGNFFNKKFKTWYSVGTSEYAKNRRNFYYAVGNKLVLKNFEAYLDLQNADFAFDHNKLSGAFAEDVNVKSAILRMDFKFLNHWSVTTKGIYETVSANKNPKLGSYFQNNIGYLIGLEYQPIKMQNMKFFTYYYGNNVEYKKGITGFKNTTSNVFAVGVLYLVNVL